MKRLRDGNDLVYFICRRLLLKEEGNRHRCRGELARKRNYYRFERPF